MKMLNFMSQIMSKLDDIFARYKWLFWMLGWFFVGVILASIFKDLYHASTLL